ncbi:MAG: formimidoylglutamase [Chitinophagaceae bacterium]
MQPLDLDSIQEGQPYADLQIGFNTLIYDHHFPDIEEADLILLGVGEQRGTGLDLGYSEGPDRIRRQLYRLYYWHPEVRLADIGNIHSGATLADTYAAVKTVVGQLLDSGKTILILGGSHDLTCAQCHAYSDLKKLIDVAIIDDKINLKEDTLIKDESFLMDMFTEEPNFIRHYNHIGFQSYFVHPKMLETLDKLRFDCYRVGKVREDLEEMEPVLRNSDLLSLDVSAIRHGDAPAHKSSPNGFFGDEICTLARYAGMSEQLSSFGIYAYQPEWDQDDLAATQIAQMIWYFMDGKSMRGKEAKMDNREEFLEFHVSFSEMQTLFLKSRKTSRWWMQIPNKQFIPCAYKDYLSASQGEIPERWLRAQERL